MLQGCFLFFFGPVLASVITPNIMEQASGVGRWGGWGRRVELGDGGVGKGHHAQHLGAGEAPSFHVPIIV